MELPTLHKIQIHMLRGTTWLQEDPRLPIEKMRSMDLGDGHRQLSARLSAHEETDIRARSPEHAKFRAEPLTPIFRPRTPKPYFPSPGPFKTGWGRV